MPRSVWKGPFFHPHLLKAVLETANAPRAHANAPLPSVRTTSRASTIIPAFVGRTIEVHNGKAFVPVACTEEMVGHKLGEFSWTRKPFRFKGDTKQARGKLKSK